MKIFYLKSHHLRNRGAYECKKSFGCCLHPIRVEYETYILAIYSHCDRTKLQFDFLSYEKINKEYEQEIKDLGGRVFYLPTKRKNIVQHYKMLENIFRTGNYAGIYYQCNRKLYTLDIFKYAKKYNVQYKQSIQHNSTQLPMSLLEKIRSFMLNGN